MTSNFTPGPWALAWEDGKHGVVASSVEGKLVCIIGNMTPDDGLNDTRKANAELIARAPEMEATIAKLQQELADLRAQSEAGDGWEDVNQVECECGEDECQKYTWIERYDTHTLLWHNDMNGDSLMYLPPGEWRLQRRRAGSEE